MRALVWVGRFRGYGGFVQSTRGYVQSLIPLVDNLIIAPMELLEPADPFNALVKQFDDNDFRLMNHGPNKDPDASAFLSVWEFDHIPQEWIDPFIQAKVILTQSRFCAEIFAKAIGDRSKIHVVSYILPPTASPIGQTIRDFGKDYFLFGSVFEWVPRKMPEIMIQAFEEEFSHNEQVCFLLRTTHPNIANVTEFVRQKFHDPRLIVINTPLPDITAFYRGLDCYISCTGGEGFGQTLSEAMACGIPTIGSRHSGNLDFMNDMNSWLVDVEPWSPVEDPMIPNEEFQWRRPKVASIRKAMREVYELKQEHKMSRKTEAALKIGAAMTPKQVGQHIFNHLQPFL